MKNFHPISTPFVRFAITPSDMPVHGLQDIPNAQIEFEHASLPHDHPKVLVPYRITNFNRQSSDRGKVIQMVTPLIEAQMQAPRVIECFGHLTLGRIVTKARRRVDEALTQARAVIPSIGFQSKLGNNYQRNAINFLHIAIGSGVRFRTYGDMGDFQKLCQERAPNKIFGTCHIFGKEAGCELSHDFFDLRRLANDTWENHIIDRVNELFPFLAPTGMFYSLKLDA